MCSAPLISKKKHQGVVIATEVGDEHGSRSAGDVVGQVRAASTATAGKWFVSHERPRGPRASILDSSCEPQEKDQTIKRVRSTKIHVVRPQRQQMHAVRQILL